MVNMDLLDLENNFFIHEEFHGNCIFKNEFPKEYKELYDHLKSFNLLKSDILKPGGRKSPIAKKFDDALYATGWEEKKFNIEIKIDNENIETPTHQIDYLKIESELN